MKILFRTKSRSYPFNCYVLLIIASFTLLSCENDDLIEEAKSFQILAIGDSRVEGHQTDFLSYRYELWKLLNEDDKNVDFFGNRIDQRVYPDFQEIPFDAQHEGKSGDRVDQVLERLDSLITAHPEMVGNVTLLGLGGNDLVQKIPLENSLRNLNLIIDKLQEANNSTTIFIEKIAPGTTSFQEDNSINESEYTAFNNAISNLAIIKSTLESRVIAVDMTTILTDGDYADDVHYNLSGAQKIANQYFEAMRILF